MTDIEKKNLHDFVQKYAVPTDFRVVHRINGMKFIIRSNEQGHNDPHVHIEDGSCSFAISLTSFIVLNKSGNYNSRKIKMAQEFIQNNKEMFISNWNEFSNGIKVDLTQGVI